MPDYGAQTLRIKFGNKDMGLITTELKKYGSTEEAMLPGKETVDFWLQIKVKVIKKADKIYLTFVPVDKSISRANPSVFYEGALIYDDKLKDEGLRQKIKARGTELYNSVLQEVCDSLGIAFDKIEHKFSTVKLTW